MEKEVELVGLIEEAERLHGLRLFDNIDREKLLRLPLAFRGDLIGRVLSGSRGAVRIQARKADHRPRQSDLDADGSPV